MQTKIVYTLISDNTDYYYEQALISIYSLRLHNPNTTIYIVVDIDTYKTLKGKRKEIYKYASTIIPIDIPKEYNKMQRSRYLKTNLRKFVKGNYLFIDCDTIICQPLDNIDLFEGEIGLVPDLNGELLLSDINTINKCNKIGFNNMKGKPYYNSGIIFAKDTTSVHLLYDTWHNLWLYSLNKGISNDQPALNKANIESNLLIKTLDHSWNCQTQADGCKYINTAKILHYYFGSNEYSYIRLTILKTIKEQGYIDSTTHKTLYNANTIAYSAFAIRNDMIYKYMNSYLLYVFFNFSSLFSLIENLAKITLKFILFIRRP